jgi:hypothetical protein
VKYMCDYYCVVTFRDSQCSPYFFVLAARSFEFITWIKAVVVDSSENLNFKEILIKSNAIKD